MNLEHFKEKLEREKQSLEKNIEYYTKSDNSLGEGMEDSVTDDTITEVEGHDRLKATRGELERSLIEVNQALGRTEKGTFGICQNCGEKISPERLEIMPTASLCLSCQEKEKRS